MNQACRHSLVAESLRSMCQGPNWVAFHTTAAPFLILLPACSLKKQ